MKQGLVGFSNNKKSFLSKLIRFFTKSNISHTFIIGHETAGEVSVLEADMVVRHCPLAPYYEKNETEQYWLYEINPAIVSQERVNESVDYCYKEFAGYKYGFTQLIWFVYRWLNDLIKRDVRKKKNWMADGVICSELVYHFLVHCGLGHLVEAWNPDTIQAEDIQKIVKERTDIFTLVYKKE